MPRSLMLFIELLPVKKTKCHRFDMGAIVTSVCDSFMTRRKIGNILLRKYNTKRIPPLADQS